MNESITRVGTQTNRQPRVGTTFYGSVVRTIETLLPGRRLPRYGRRATTGLVIRLWSAVGLCGRLQPRLDAHRRDTKFAAGPPPFVRDHRHR